MSRTSAVLAAVLCLATPARSDDQATNAATLKFREREVARIPYGHRPRDMKPNDCGDSECSLGFVFDGPDGSIYLYDHANSNVKIMRPQANATFRVEVLPTLRPEPHEQPDDGAVTQDGAVYLLSMKGTTPDRYRVYALDPGASEWASHVPFEESALPLDARLALPRSHEARLLVLGGQDVILCDARHPDQPGRRIASQGRFLPAREQTQIALDHPFRDGDRVGQNGDSIAALGPGWLLGRDRTGRSFRVIFGPGNGEVHYECRDSTGRLVARTRIPRRREFARLDGASTFLAPDGSIQSVHATRGAVTLSRWTVDPDR